MRLRTLIAACAAALFLVAGAGTAQAADFVVNSTGDASDNFRGDGVCADSGGQCTFRAALDESEYGYRYGDGRTTIFFGPMFDGQATDRVVISRPLEVPYKTTIEGGNCGSGGLPKPCVWVGYPSPSNQAVITTSFDPIIAGLAIGNGAVGIQTTMQEGILARNWLGIALDGSATPNGIGINSGTSYGGVIGGGTLSQGNFIVGGDIGMIAQAVQNYQGGGVINNTIGVNP